MKSHEQSLLPPDMTQLRKLGDRAMHPIMALLGGFHADSIQETHMWHPFRIDPLLLDDSMFAEAAPDRNAPRRRAFFFHVPLVPGLGWKQYSVVEASEQPFYIGWSTEERQTGESIDTAVHRLKIGANVIRMLNGPIEERVRFFGINQNGEQIPVRITDTGLLGENRHAHIRLF
jgi:hypothetical protein